MYRLIQFFKAFCSVACLILILSGCAAPQKTETDAEKGPVFYPELPDPPRIQFLTSFAGPDDVEIDDKSDLARFVLGDEEPEERGLVKPYGVAMHENKLYAVDTRGNGYVVFDLEQRAYRSVKGMKKPINITIDRDGNKYVTDTLMDRVVVFDRFDKKVDTIGRQLDIKPGDVAVLENKLYVTDLRNQQVHVLDKATGERLYSIGSAGSSEGNLYYPTNLALGTDDNLFISDTGNFRVVEYSPEGQYLRKLGELGSGLGNFARPKGVAIDRDGRIYVVDAAFQNIQVFTGSGRLLMFFGAPGLGPGELYLPTDISIDYENLDYFREFAEPGFEIEYLILVSNQYGPRKVNIYGFGKMRGMSYD